MQIPFLVDKHIGVFDSRASILRLGEVSLQEVEDSFVLFGVHSMVFEESYQKGLFADEKVPEQTIKWFFTSSVLLSSYLLDPFAKLLLVIDPEGDGVVSEPVPAHPFGAELGGCLFLVQGVQEESNVHAVEGLSLHECAFAQDENSL